MTEPSIDTEFLRWRDAGEPSALAAVFDRLAPELLLVAGHFAGAIDDAEDLVQETFLAAIDRAGDWDANRPLRPWLIGILANRARRLRAERRRLPDPERLPERESTDPAEALLARETATAVAEAISGLPPLYREALTLNTVHGLTPTQIAQASGISPNTVKTRLHRARQMVESALPAALATGVALLGASATGLAAVRARVLDHAGSLVPTPGPDAGQSAGLRSATEPLGGGISGKAAATAVAILLAVGGTVLAWQQLQDGRGNTAPTTTTRTGDAAGSNADSDASPPAEKESLDPSTDRTASEAVAAAPGGLRVLVRHPDGTPAADVALRALPTATTLAHLDERRARTNAAGIAELGSWAARSVTVEVGRGGLGTAELDADGNGTLTIDLPSARMLSGHVQLPDGSPAGGARVLVAAPGRFDDPLVATTADSAGNFEIRSLAATHLLCARTDGYVTTPLVQPPGDDPVELRFDQSALTVTGRVEDADSRAVAGARILVGLSFPEPALDDPKLATGRRPAEFLWSDEDGRFRAASVPPEPEVFVWSRIRGQALRAGSIVLEPGRGADVMLRLEPGGAMTGRLLGHDGKPAAGATILIRDSNHDLPEIDVHPPRFARSLVFVGPDGQYAVDGLLPIELELRATDAAGEHGAVGTLTPKTGEASIWNAQLAPPGTLYGFLSDAAGTPLAGYVLEPQVPLPWRAPAPVQTDERGRFTFETGAQAPHRLLVRLPDRAWAGVLATRERAEPVASPVHVIVPDDRLPTASLVGTLRGMDGQPAAATHYAIVLYDEQQSRGMLRLDNDSRFAAERLPAGRYQLILLRRDGLLAPLMERVAVAPGERTDLGTLTFPQLTGIRVSVLDGTGGPVRGTTVTARLGDGFFVAEASTDASGVAEFRLPPGDYHFFDRECLPDTAPALATLTLGEARTVELRRPATTKLHHFELRHADDGQDLRVRWSVFRNDVPYRVWTGFWKRGANSQQVLTRAFPPGDWRIEVRDHAGRSATSNIRISTADSPPPAGVSAASSAAPPVTVLELK